MSPPRLSGNPGYLPGRPMRVGKLLTNDTAGGTSAAALPGGTAAPAFENEHEGKRAIVLAGGGDGSLRLLGADATGACAAAATAVLFGEDLLAGCAERLGREAFATRCTAPLPMALLNVSDRFVGALGNADPLRSWEWVEVRHSSYTIMRSWEWVEV